jgi:DNA-binding transcriptional ArsR family regulator
LTEPAGKPSRALRDLDDIDAVFGALGNASRRHILQVLSARGSLTAGELAERFSHAWPTTTRHLRVLLDAGLITVTPVGRERHYQLARQRLGGVVALWLASVGLVVRPADEPPSTPGGQWRR